MSSNPAQNRQELLKKLRQKQAEQKGVRTGAIKPSGTRRGISEEDKVVLGQVEGLLEKLGDTNHKEARKIHNQIQGALDQNRPIDAQGILKRVQGLLDSVS